MWYPKHCEQKSETVWPWDASSDNSAQNKSHVINVSIRKQKSDYVTTFNDSLFLCDNSVSVNPNISPSIWKHRRSRSSILYAVEEMAMISPTVWTMITLNIDVLVKMLYSMKLLL